MKSAAGAMRPSIKMTSGRTSRSRCVELKLSLAGGGVRAMAWSASSGLSECRRQQAYAYARAALSGRSAYPAATIQDWL